MQFSRFGGLGGLGSSGQSSVESVADWANYDGTSDGDSNFFYTDEGVAGPSAIAAASSTEFVALTRVRSGTSSGRYAEVYSVDGDTVARESSLKLSSNGGIFPDLVKMTETQYLGIFADTLGTMQVYIITKSGTTLTEADLDNATFADDSRASIRRLTDTTAVMLYRDSADNLFKVVIIDTTSNSLTFGTPVSTGENPNEYSGLAVLSSTEFIAAVSDNVFYYTVSGSTITLGDTLTINSTGTAFSSMAAATVDSDTVLVAYEFDSTTDSILANTFTVSGGELSRGTEATIDTGSRWFGGPQGGNLVPLDDQGNFMFSTVLLDTDANNAAKFIISVDGSSITSGSAITNQNGDHNFLEPLPDTDFTRVVSVSQDNSTTPADQLNFKILHGE